MAGARRGADARATSYPTKRARRCAPQPPAGAQRVAVVRFPFGSNLDEFHLLAQPPHSRSPPDPPTRRRRSRDTARLQARGRRPRLAAPRRLRRRVAGRWRAARARVSAGAPDARHAYHDPHGVEGAAAGRPGSTSCRLDTVMDPDKITRRPTVEFRAISPTWASLAASRARLRDPQRPSRAGGPGVGEGSGARDHRARTARGPRRRSRALVGVRPPPVLDATFDALADAVDEHLDTSLLHRLVQRLPASASFQRVGRWWRHAMAHTIDRDGRRAGCDGGGGVRDPGGREEVDAPSDGGVAVVGAGGGGDGREDDGWGSCLGSLR